MPAGVMGFSRRTYSHPAWAKDYGSREHLLPGGAKVDATQFTRETSVLVTVAAGGAAQGATSVPVDALSGPIPSGQVFRFNGGQLAVTSAAALTGATAITVEALAAAIPAAATAYYMGNGRIFIASGTVLGRTLAEATAGTGFGPAVDSDDEIFLLYHPIDDAANNDDADLYRPGSLVAVNFLPGWATMAAGLQAEIRARYQCTNAAD